MTTLQHFLLNHNYTKVKLHKTITNHFEIIAKLNGVKSRFIIDTGASNSCIGFDSIGRFKLQHLEDSEIKAAGAGAIDMKTQQSKYNTLQIQSWKLDRFTLVVIDMSHINMALANHNASTISGIIGADVLDKGKAVIDYNKKYLYLK